jgi:hypothetical protein
VVIVGTTKQMLKIEDILREMKTRVYKLHKDFRSNVLLELVEHCMEKFGCTFKQKVGESPYVEIEGWLCEEAMSWLHTILPML